MAKSTSVELGNELEDFIASQLTIGRYGSASEVIRAGLRLLQDEETKLAAMRAGLVSCAKDEKSTECLSFLKGLYRR